MADGVSWDFYNPVRCVFGSGSLSVVESLVEGRVLIVTTTGMTQRGVSARVAGLVGKHDALIYDRVKPNPDLADVKVAIGQLANAGIGSIVALGGGSALDFGKVLSLALRDPTVDVAASLDARNPYQGVTPLPLVAIPTTAGTGSEVTPFATVWDHQAKRKHSLSSPRLFARAAVLDPELTLSLPWEATLSPGLDALTQCIESIWNRNACTLTSAYAERGVVLAADSLLQLQRNLGDRAAREGMLQASLLSGLAISHTRTAIAHSMSYPITANFGVPHGLACALALPAIARFNTEADDGRLGALARRLGLPLSQGLDRWLEDLLRRLDAYSHVRRYVSGIDDLLNLAPQMITPGRAGNNLRHVDVEDVRAILNDAGKSLFVF